MEIEEALVTRLLAQTAVTALTSTIRPDQLNQTDHPTSPDDTIPGIIISVDDETFDDQNIEGTTDLVTARITISAISGKKRIARQLARAIAKNGTDPGTGLQGCKVRNGTVDFDAMLEKRMSGYIPNADGSDSGLYSVDSVFTVKYYETY